MYHKLPTRQWRNNCSTSTIAATPVLVSDLRLIKFCDKESKLGKRLKHFVRLLGLILKLNTINSDEMSVEVLINN